MGFINELQEKLGIADWDDALAYSTIKIVKIRDARLGAFYYVSTLAIFLYIIISIILNQKYLSIEPPSSGSVRMNLKAPSTIKSPSQLTYCSTSVRCAYLPSDVVAPTLEDGSLLATTRVSLFNLTYPPGCASPSIAQNLPPTDPSCLATAQPSTPYYIADIESYTMLIDHVVLGKETGVAQRTQQMPGKLVDQNGNVIKEFPADVNSPGDIVTLAEIIQAAGLGSQGLDQSSLAPGTSSTIRFDGKVIIIYINYGVRESNPSELKYTYQVKPVDQTEFKWQEPLYNANGNTITIANRHGLRIVVQQTGSIGKFDFMALLVNLVASLALTRVAVFIVEIAMLNILPEKELYTAAKIQTTDDFDKYYKRNYDGTEMPQPSEESKPAATNNV
ncbi:hypothetical protein MIR68_002359 [Amoeboaphelidium protococcarum]|nr:hypothetical protein MIR68_002359 [Amoeboaphelidium protococcarum]KAI3650797.1 hypothetical protein MP228_004278 [Amoeboaphelidium protococcarum]KAI3652284.1 hypothetical protein MP228_003587 [Amoeboaphelidium protococcarum]